LAFAIFYAMLFWNNGDNSADGATRSRSRLSQTFCESAQVFVVIEQRPEKLWSICLHRRCYSS